MKWARWRRRLKIVVAAYAVFRIAIWCVPRTPLKERVATSTAVYDAHHRLLRLTLASDEQYRLWTPLDRISPLVQEATLLYEDRWFYSHPGVNPIALVRAMRSTVGGGRRVGASTLSMQLARRLWHLDTRTFGGKLLQIARALQLEALYSKDEILEAYLNTVPYGGNVEGVGAASLVTFGKTADKLTLAEALTLAVIPQNPTRRGSASAGQAPAPLLEARARLWESWCARHPEAAKSNQAALVKLPIALKGTDELPFLAPHFVDEVLAREATTEARLRPAEIVTTLDLGLEKLIERHARAWVAQKARIGIQNAVVMLVDWRTMEVKAQLGSVDWRNQAISGQVNGATAKRSPGSTLKPFVYALAVEQGVLHPETMLKDAPAEFGGWSPENFDGKYAGPVSAREALVRSRNVPAVTVAGKLNKPSFYEWLKIAGVSRLENEQHYGLGLALGGAELSMEELITLYAMLGAGGELRPLRLERSDPLPKPADGVRLLSEEASFVALDMLKDNPRPDRSRSIDEERLRVAWKTGTSWGFRDAWSVGLVGRYALAVWVGNFDGEGNPALVGVQAAAPLFFEIVDALAADDPGLTETPSWARPPKGVRKVAVCALSGGLPGASCPRQKSTWFLPGKSPIDVCDVHRPVLIDDATGKRACAASVGRGQKAHEEVFEVWPSDMRKLFAQAGLPRRAVPGPAPGCEDSDGATAGMAPHITRPLRGVTYTLRRGRDEDKIALSAVTDGDAREVYWFVDRELVGKADSGQSLFYALRPGRYIVRAVDDHGRSDARDLRVEWAP